MVTRYLNIILHGCILIMSVMLTSGNAGEKQSRVISLSPHITEIIFKIGAGSFLVGRTDFCTFPQAAAGIESVGGYLNIDFERITRLEPDFILQFPNPENRRKLENLGFTVVDVPNETIGEILAGIEKVGLVLEKSREAKRLCQHIRDTLKLVADMGQIYADSVRAILVVGRQQGSLANIYLAGGTTYLSEIWEYSGGINTFRELNMRYFSVNEEDLLKRKVEAILEFHPGWSDAPGEREKQKYDWQVLGHLKAIVNDHIFIFTERYFVIPGPRITQVAMRFSEIIRTCRDFDP